MATVAERQGAFQALKHESVFTRVVQEQGPAMEVVFRFYVISTPSNLSEFKN